MFELDNWTGKIRLLALVAIAISAATWTMDITGFVYACPFCRVQRTVIGLLGLLMLLPNPGHWIARYVGSVLAVLGLVVGAMQHFDGWKEVLDGKFVLAERWYLDSFMLSGFALFIIVGQVLMLYAYKEPAR